MNIKPMSQWQDDYGDWLQRTFVSRADNVIVHSLVAPAGAKINGAIWLDEVCKCPLTPIPLYRGAGGRYTDRNIWEYNDL